VVDLFVSDVKPQGSNNRETGQIDKKLKRSLVFASRESKNYRQKSFS